MSYWICLAQNVKREKVVGGSIEISMSLSLFLYILPILHICKVKLRTDLYLFSLTGPNNQYFKLMLFKIIHEIVRCGGQLETKYLVEASNGF